MVPAGRLALIVAVSRHCHVIALLNYALNVPRGTENSVDIFKGFVLKLEIPVS